VGDGICSDDEKEAWVMIIEEAGRADATAIARRRAAARRMMDIIKNNLKDMIVVVVVVFDPLVVFRKGMMDDVR
jgi:hypothetical protein